jgi:hypothetical protein
MDDLVRTERSTLPYWICFFHGLGIFATTVVGVLLLRAGDFWCAGFAGIWLLIPHLFGIFHAWSFPLCRPACRTLLGAAIPMAMLTALIAFLALAEIGASRRHFRMVGPHEPFLAIAGILIAPLVQHALELSAFLKARRIANTSAFGGRWVGDDGVDIDLRRD